MLEYQVSSSSSVKSSRNFILKILLFMLYKL
jgi:hypothetical protein